MILQAATFTESTFINAKPKFIEPRPYADPEAAARKLMELADAVKPVQDGRIHVEKLNGPFLFHLRADANVQGSKMVPTRGDLRSYARLAH